MLRKSWILILLLALALAGCGGGAAPVKTAQVTSEPYASATTASQQAAAPSQPAGTATAATESQSTNGPVPAGCTVVSPQPTPGPTEQSLFPPITDQDWVQGPDTAAVTLLEYGDFQ